jgi:nucleotide-binding universal stress UspA family protein
VANATLWLVGLYRAARKAGATNVEEKPIVGAPIDALVHLAEEVHADLLVVGNVGLSSVTGRPAPVRLG